MSKCTYNNTTTRSMPIGLILYLSKSSSWIYGHVQAKFTPILQSPSIGHTGTISGQLLLPTPNDITPEINIPYRVLSHHPSHVFLPMFLLDYSGFFPWWIIGKPSTIHYLLGMYHYKASFPNFASSRFMLKKNWGTIIKSYALFGRAENEKRGNVRREKEEKI